MKTITYTSRDEKTYAVLESFTNAQQTGTKTFLVYKREVASYNLDDMDAGFIFMALISDDYSVKKIIDDTPIMTENVTVDSENGVEDSVTFDRNDIPSYDTTGDITYETNGNVVSATLTKDGSRKPDKEETVTEASFEREELPQHNTEGDFEHDTTDSTTTATFTK